MFQMEELPEAALPATEPSHGLPTCEAPDGHLTFVRRKGRYQIERPVRLENSMLMSVGLLELANAGDFAANVFNSVPLAPYAIALIAIGGVVALSIPYFAVKDARLSIINLRGLRAERRFLQEQKKRYAQNQAMRNTIDCFLDVNHREIGSEFINRFVLDTIMGFGALLVGIGTLLALYTEDRRVWYASNLLTGYIGNSPCALYGLINFPWSVWVWRRSARHKEATLPGITDQRTKELVEMRASSVQFHSALNAIGSLVAGAASLATSTMWWGYVVLAPCLVTSGLVNLFWRTRVGYDRPFIRELLLMDGESVMDALSYADECHRRYVFAQGEPLSVLVANPKSMSSVMEFITEHQLFEDFCLRVLSDADLLAELFPEAGDSLTIIWRRFTAVSDEVLAAKLLKIASDVIRAAAPACFRNQERYLLEALGCYMSTTTTKRLAGVRGAADTRRTTRPRHQNAQSTVGRHANDWLFGGFSMSRLVKEAFRT